MDLATLIGIVLAFAAIMISMVMEGGNPAAIIAPPAMLLVFAYSLMFIPLPSRGTIPDVLP